MVWPLLLANYPLIRLDKQYLSYIRFGLAAVTMILTIWAIFQAQFSQVCPAAMAPNVGPRVPIHSFSTPGMEQQIFHGQAPHALVLPQVTSLLLLCTQTTSRVGRNG